MLNGAGMLEKAKATSTVLLDVRTADELASGFVPGSQHLDVKSSSFEMTFDLLDRSKTYVAFCASGIRSGNAAAAMREKGFTSVFTLEGGLKANPDITTVAGMSLPDGLKVTTSEEDGLTEWKYDLADGYSFAEVNCTTQVNDLCLGYAIDFQKEDYGKDSVFLNLPEAQNWIIMSFNQRNQNP